MHDSILAQLLNSWTLPKHENTLCYWRLYEPISNSKNRRDLIIIQNASTIFVIKLTTGFETNIDISTKRKANKYKEVLKSLENKFEKKEFYQLKYGGLEYSWSS